MDSHGPQQPRFDIFELTQALWRVLGSHFKFGGKFKFVRFLHKTQQHGCLQIPLDPVNQDFILKS